MKKHRFISALLTFIMVFGMIGNLSILPVYAADPATEEEVVPIDYMTQIFATAEEKLATMELKLDAFGYELYYEKNTGEVAYREKATGQIMFTNPYDIPKAFPDGLASSEDTKAMLLSQVVIKYTDNDKEVNFYSYTEAAARDQIVQKNIKNGIRVEYTMGRSETRKLVPKLINKDRFETLILAYIDDPTAYKKITAFYTLKDPNDPELTERAVKELQATFPITTEMAVYVFDPYASERELNLIEAFIKTYCPHYTYETLQEDHNMTDYSASDARPALFKLSLEYYLDENGLTVRLPANGIRFDEGMYSLTYIMVLPFMGAGSSDYKGYTFYPDGSGTLVRFEDIQNTRTITGELYGMDFAYHKLTSNHMETLRLPVFGVVENYKATVTTSVEEEVPGYTDDFGDYIEPTVKTTTVKEDVVQDRGYLAIIEEGDALAKITTNHGAFILHRYNSVYTTFYPRPKDSYNLAESISVGANAEWTVVSKRKYTGSYRIRYIMLTDKGIAEENNITDYYECSYVGMAKVYRDYLEKQGILTRFTETEVKKDIPLYIESFGVMDVLDTFMSIPVIIKTPLTTFENLKTMYSQLSEAGISNINFRLQGFTNGGMQQTVPYNVKFENKLGGNSGYASFLELAAANGFGVFPDFDFLYADRQKLLDGFTTRTDAVKTIDNRYTRKRVYDSSTQSLRRTGLLAISPSVLSKFYNKFSDSMAKLGLNGISVATLGTDLNSDFDKKDPYNREDAKKFVLSVFDEMYAECNNIMVDGGNAYALKYVSHILNASIDSSHHTYASEMVPFLGMVLHGYINFTGSPTNMAGDINYEILKIIENGAAPYFTLSYQNIAELKDDMHLSKYYSVSYEIWFNDLVNRYKQINDALSTLQTSLIENHEFLIGERVPTEREIAEDLAAKETEAEAKAEADALEAEKAALQKARDEYLASQSGEAIVDETVTEETTAPEEETAVDEALVEEYVITRYTIDNGSIVRVTYEDGTAFILNYNNFVVTTEGYTIPAIGYLKIVD